MSRMKMQFHIVLTLVLLLTSAVLKAEKGSPVVTDLVQEKPLMNTLWVPGTVISRNHARIAAEVSGRIEWIADVGTHADETVGLAQVDTAAVTLEIKELEVEIKRLQVEIDYQRRKVARLREMDKRKNVSRELLEEAETELLTARQDLNKERLKLQRKQLEAERAEIKAPFEGTVVERYVRKGEFVHEGEDVLKLVDADHLEIRAMVPMNAARYLDSGQKVSLKYDDQLFEGQVRVVLPVGDEASHSVEIRVGMDADHWFPGTPVRVQVPNSDSRTVLLVSRDALVLRDKEVYVYRVTAEGRAERVRVETGLGDGALVSVVGKLNAGDKVIIRGAERLKDGQAVMPLSPADALSES